MFGFIRIAFMNFAILYRFCVANEHWYAWFVLIAVNFICRCAWLVTMCDIWSVVGVSCTMNAACGKGPYLPSWTCVSISSFNGAPVAETLGFEWEPLIPICSLSLWPFSFGMLALVTQMLSAGFPYFYWVSHCHCI
jgi:hypothetical protein